MWSSVILLRIVPKLTNSGRYRSHNLSIPQACWNEKNGSRKEIDSTRLEASGIVNQNRFATRITCMQSLVTLSTAILSASRRFFARHVSSQACCQHYNTDQH